MFFWRDEFRTYAAMHKIDIALVSGGDRAEFVEAYRRADYYFRRVNQEVADHVHQRTVYAFRALSEDAPPCEYSDAINYQFSLVMPIERPDWSLVARFDDEDKCGYLDLKIAAEGAITEDICRQLIDHHPNGIFYLLLRSVHEYVKSRIDLEYLSVALSWSNHKTLYADILSRME